MEEFDSSFVDDGDEYLSSGYLQDVFFHFTSKRRRLSNAPLIKNFSTTLPQMTNSHTHSAELLKRGEEANSDSSSISISSHNDDNQWTPHKTNLHCMDPIFSSVGGIEGKRKKRVVAKVVYPFALVKPGGFEGNATLNDINERILMRPMRPVRHPVGDFACRPLVSPDGPGLSGKAVVAFTRIHTQGKGTVTIIRTRG